MHYQEYVHITLIGQPCCEETKPLAESTGDHLTSGDPCVCIGALGRFQRLSHIAFQPPTDKYLHHKEQVPIPQ